MFLADVTTASLSSIHREQQRLFAEQAKLANDFERVSAELRDVKKKLWVMNIWI